LKSIIDNFGIYVIEESLLVKLPKIFMPAEVSKLDDATISRLASESEESVLEREDLTRKLKILEQTMKTMEQFYVVETPRAEQYENAAAILSQTGQKSRKRAVNDDALSGVRDRKLRSSLRLSTTKGRK
jgi:hypothetical protein